MSKIILEDFNEGNGYYKVNLAYLNKEQVEEIETLVSKWNPTDEDIKSCIAMCLTDANEQRFKDYGTNLKDCLDWLEKQSVQKEYTFKSLPRLLDMIEPTSKAKTYCQKLIGTLVKEGYSTDAKIVGECLKQMNGEKVAMATMDEQKPADKVEPKFHEGEWIISNNKKSTYQVIEVKGGIYVIRDNVDNHEYHISIEECEKTGRLWNISDAKVGDVLVHNNFLFIFIGIKNGIVKGICTELSNTISNFGMSEYNIDYFPTTKEQRELLLSKMKDAGYEFDFEEKELKKIEQKSTDNIVPKFKIGDWIVSSVLGIAHIIGVNDANEYQLEYIDGKQEFSSIDYVNYEYDEWTIKDAKDGDVLAWDDSKCIALFKNIYDEDSFNSYGFVGHCTGAFESRLSYHDIKGAHPATKKQRDILFSKLKEAGYEWDEDKKELKLLITNGGDFFESKNCEQKPAVLLRCYP